MDRRSTSARFARAACAWLAFATAIGGCDAPSSNGEGHGGDRCVTCHEGIEQAHGPIPADECTICHGGDGASQSATGAHVAIPEDWAEIRGAGLPPAPEGFIKDFASDQLDAIDPAYVRFINPGDIRVVWSSCGRCHPGQARSMPNSVMTTNAGHYYPTLLLAGLQEDRLAHYGSYAASDPDCDPAIEGTVCEVRRLVPPDRDALLSVVSGGDPAEIERVAYEHYLAKNCNTCHQGGYPRNDSPGLYRSTGCTSCHMLYGELGNYEGGDPTIPRGVPVHPLRHEITRAVTTQQCATCHFQGGRIGLLYQGIREGGFGGASTPEFGLAIDRTLYGHAAGYYFTDEDTRNDVDETPPDVHFQRGMHCADCHVGAEVHGDGRLYSSSKHQVDLRCEDCHGDSRVAARPDPDGFFRTSRGRALPQLSVSGGDVVLTGVVDGVEHRVPQPARLLAPGGGANDEMRAAMGDDASGFSHVDTLTCDTCHTSYNLTCIGCHVSYDLRLSQVDYQTGTVTPGLTRGGRASYTLDQVLIGQGPDGRAQTVVASQQVDMTVIGASAFGVDDGTVLVGTRIDARRTVGRFRHANGSVANNGFAPFFQHTTSRGSRGCDACHRRDDTPEEMARARGVYGFGTGEFLLDADDGSQVDGLRFLDDAGEPTTTWVHPGTGPLPAPRRDRALGFALDALP